MAGNGTTTYARVRSSYVERALERERSAVDICAYRYACLLSDIQRELAQPHRDLNGRLAELLNEAVYAEAVLSVARAELAEAEEA